MASTLTREPLDVAALSASVAWAGLGGTTAFIGTVRRSAEDGDVVGIEYSAYEAMAEAEFARILAEVRRSDDAPHHLGVARLGDVVHKAHRLGRQRLAIAVELARDLTLQSLPGVGLRLGVDPGTIYSADGNRELRKV